MFYIKESSYITRLILFIQIFLSMSPPFALIGTLLITYVAVFTALVHKNVGTFFSNTILLALFNKVMFTHLTTPFDCRVFTVVKYNHILVFSRYFLKLLDKYSPSLSNLMTLIFFLVNFSIIGLIMTLKNLLQSLTNLRGLLIIMFGIGFAEGKSLVYLCIKFKNSDINWYELSKHLRHKWSLGRKI